MGKNLHMAHSLQFLRHTVNVHNIHIGIVVQLLPTKLTKGHNTCRKLIRRDTVLLLRTLFRQLQKPLQNTIGKVGKLPQHPANTGSPNKIPDTKPHVLFKMRLPYLFIRKRAKNPPVILPIQAPLISSLYEKLFNPFGMGNERGCKVMATVETVREGRKHPALLKPRL